MRILCKQDTREDRPEIFVENGLFLLPIRNGEYAIIKGEGYFDIPPITDTASPYRTKLDFQLDTSSIGNSEMQHMDFAYATSLVRTFLQDESLVLTIRGRKYTPRFSFRVGVHEITAERVQTEVDAGYEGKSQVVLVEAKNANTTNVIVRQLFYPFRQWKTHIQKPVKTLFFEKRENLYSLCNSCLTTLMTTTVSDWNIRNALKLFDHRVRVFYPILVSWSSIDKNVLSQIVYV